jgi:aminoglycoside phosphotransferase
VNAFETKGGPITEEAELSDCVELALERVRPGAGPAAESVKPPHELVRALARVQPPAEVREQRLNSDVYRLDCSMNGTGRWRSFIAKRLEPATARRNELVIRRWLPAVGLGDSAPQLLAVAAEPDASWVWHVYEDLADSGLDPSAGDAAHVALAVAAIAKIHTRFGGHPLLPECRLWGGDLGISFYVASVQDASTSLGSLRARRGPLSADHSSLCRRLLARLTDLRAQGAARAETLSRAGGPETLLHGDLWPMNVMVVSDNDSCARLIDWDHAGRGPVAYDLSTFLSRFPVARRMTVLRIYADEVARAGWDLRSPAELNEAFETAELGRIANRVIWPALAAWEGDTGWSFDALAEVERWFEELRPVLAVEQAC